MHISLHEVAWNSRGRPEGVRRRNSCSLLEKNLLCWVDIERSDLISIPVLFCLWLCDRQIKSISHETLNVTPCLRTYTAHPLSEYIVNDSFITFGRLIRSHRKEMIPDSGIDNSRFNHEFPEEWLKFTILDLSGCRIALHSALIVPTLRCQNNDSVHEFQLADER